MHIYRYLSLFLLLAGAVTTSVKPMDPKQNKLVPTYDLKQIIEAMGKAQNEKFEMLLKQQKETISTEVKFSVSEALNSRNIGRFRNRMLPVLLRRSRRLIFPISIATLASFGTMACIEGYRDDYENIKKAGLLKLEQGTLKVKSILMFLQQQQENATLKRQLRAAKAKEAAEAQMLKRKIAQQKTTQQAKDAKNK